MTNHDRIGALEEAARKTSSQNRIMVAVAAGTIFIAALAWLVIRDYPGDRVYYDPDPEGQEHASGPCVRGNPVDKGAKALELVSYPWRNLGYSVEFRGPRRGYLGVVHTADKRIEVFVRPCVSIESIASTLGHEFGHAVDAAYMSDAERGEYETLRRISGPWFPTCERLCSDYNSPAGDFAEVFSFFSSPPGRFRSTMASPPTPELRGLCTRTAPAP